jgi:hypothetical protein
MPPILLLLSAIAAAPPVWSPAMLRDPAVWSAAPGLAAAGPAGLRLEVAAGARFAVALSRPLTLPAEAGLLRLKVRLGGGASWTFQAQGQVRGLDLARSTYHAWTPYWEVTFEGPVERVIDPRMIHLADRPEVRLRLAAVGPPGATVEVTSLDFVSQPRPAAPVIEGQKSIEVVEWMPRLPQPFAAVDWRRKALDFHDLVFDWQARGQYLPLIFMDQARTNLDGPMFGFGAYVGGNYAAQRAGQEAATCLPAVIASTLAGLDMSAGPHDYAAMCDGFFNRREGLVLDYTGSRSGETWWYEIWPTVLYAMLAEQYPGRPVLTEHFHTCADRLLAMNQALRGADGVPDYRHKAYDHRAGKPVDKDVVDEADAAFGVAWVLYAAGRKWGDERYLRGAESALAAMEKLSYVPTVELLPPFGALTAVRMRAELGLEHQPDRFVRQCFDISDAFGCGLTWDRWGGYDVCGLYGDTSKAYGYESAAWAAGLVPVARYDPGYARAIGKWLVNLSNSLRLTYPGQMPPENGTMSAWTGDPRHAIPYESLRLQYRGHSPAANSDACYYDWKATDLSLYSGAMQCFLGGLAQPTEVSGIDRIDLLATDFYRDRAWPSWLYYNPYDAARTVTLEVGPEPRDLYEATGHRFLARGVAGRAAITVPADRAVVVVVTPAGGAVTRDGRKLRVDGVVVDYQS